MKLQKDKIRANWLKMPLWIRVVVVIAALAIIAWIVIPGSLPDLPTARVASGTFIIDLNETGRLRAENSVTVSAPTIRTSLQIVELIPEGTVVKNGDIIIRFDQTELQSIIDDRAAELAIARSNLTRSQASMESQMASMESSVESSRASYRLSELSLDQMKFEADARIEQGKLQLKQAEISLKQAEQQLEAQKKINLEDIRSLELKIKQAEIELEKSYIDLEKLTVKAPSPGLVVYKEIWKGGTMDKIKVGDTPWRGQALIELPDLSVMLVETSVSEINISKVKVGQDAEIKLDAYPDPIFHGKIIDVAVLASTNEGVSDARVFDVEIRIKESDELLRPGMSASARIIVDEIPDKIWIPIEAIFDRDGNKIVWAASGGGFKQQEVKLGERNDNFVVIESGLKSDDLVALIDPNVAENEGSSLKKTDDKSSEGDTEAVMGDKPQKRSNKSSGRKRR
ncbi:efflux RND transporter periplasmic adaptor subunit [bacterium]|nr:efflux RND transporter periplasmic adaptor subunit [bacterium]